jgi:hypothetical protein
VTRRARLFWIAIGILSTVLLAGAVYAVVVFQQGTARQARAIAAIVERREPLHARDIAFAGPDCSEAAHAAFARLTEVLQTAPEADAVLDLDQDELATARAFEPARASLPLLERFVALEPEPPRSKASEEVTGSQRIWRRVADPLRTTPLSERDRLAVDLARALNEPLWPEAQAVCLESPETGEREVRAMSPGEPMPNISIFGWLATINVPLKTAPAFALEGNGEESMRRWMTAFRGAQRIRALPYPMGHGAWTLVTLRALSTLWTMLPSLPRSFDLKEVEQALRSIDAASQATRALVGERALGNDVFEWWRGTLQGTPGDEHRDWSRLITIPWVAHDHAFYLEAMTEAIRRAGLPYQDALAQRSDWERDVKRFPRTATISMMILPRIDDVFRERALLEARVRAALVALIARREGADAGVRAAASQLDPFDGQPLRARVGSDGLFVVWSIGANLVDDGAPAEDDTTASEPRDVVWRVRLP